MKKILFSLFVLGLFMYSSGQTRKFEVICEVYDRNISYAGMDLVLPDSVKGAFVKLDRKSRLSGLGIVNYLCVNGWTLINAAERWETASVSSRVYILKRDFLFSEQDYQEVLKATNEWMKTRLD